MEKGKEKDLIMESNIRFNGFFYIDIKPRSILHFDKDPDITCEVISNNKVKFREENHSLSALFLLPRDCLITLKMYLSLTF